MSEFVGGPLDGEKVPTPLAGVEVIAVEVRARPDRPVAVDVYGRQGGFYLYEGRRYKGEAGS